MENSVAIILKPKTLPKILQQANTNGIKGTILLNKEGDMLAYSGEDMNTNQMCSAIMANIWTSFENVDSSLEVMLYYFQNGVIAVTRVSVLLLCCFGDLKTDIGMLKLKTEKIAAYMAPEITEVLENIQREELKLQKQKK